MGSLRLLLSACLIATTVFANEDEEKRKDVRRSFLPGPGGRGPPPMATHVMHQPSVAVHTAAQTIGLGMCPGGKSLDIPCDVKRPWPQCPPQSYCFASNSADIGPYYCCPIWSTYGAGWRPRAPFYPYYPPMPYNWPEVIKATAGWPNSVAPGALYSGWAAGWPKKFKKIKVKVDKQAKKAATD